MKTTLTFFVLFFFSAAYSQKTLTSGDTLLTNINAGDSHKYKVKIEKGNFYKLVVFQSARGLAPQQLQNILMMRADPGIH